MQGSKRAALPADDTVSGHYLLRSLGRSEVLLDGQRVVWPARSAEELLWFLHAHPSGKYRHDILWQLWGLEDTPAGANRFRVALHRLRSVLGRPDAVTEEQGRYVLHPDLIAASDTYAIFEAVGHAAHSPTTPAEREQLGQALARAQGEYLPHLQGEWVEQARVQHRAAVVSGYLTLWQLHCGARECSRAAWALAQAAQGDPLIGEDHHQRLMMCLAANRNRFAAIEHYRRYRYFLAREVGDTPMNETVELAERIKEGQQTCLLKQSEKPLLS